jgi:hypothetical protein
MTRVKKGIIINHVQQSFNQNTNESRECTQIQIALYNHQSWDEWTRDNPEVIFELRDGRGK